MLVECGPHCCGVEEAECENRQFSRAQLGDYEDLAEVFWTGPLKGFGLRARRTIPNGHFVAEYVGDIVSQERISNWQYVMSLPHGLAIDASKAGGPARFINHSCEPNCVAQRWQVAGRYRVGVFAARDIQAEEEITFSYSSLRGQSSSSDACHCGSPLCSGRIWQPPKKAPKKTAKAKAAVTASCKPTKQRRQRGGTCDLAPPGKSKASEAAEVENDAEAEQVEDCKQEATSTTAEDARQTQVGTPVRKTIEVHWEQHDWELSEKFCEAFFYKAAWQNSPKEARQMLEQQQLPCSRELAAASALGLYLPSALLSARESPLCR
ncbi:Nsd1 [Symbiodinium sp. CCMP2456]|nr:Nsd1 [Symbiodinium sp. CCMP2456]